MIQLAGFGERMSETVAECFGGRVLELARQMAFLKVDAVNLDGEPCPSGPASQGDLSEAGRANGVFS